MSIKKERKIPQLLFDRILALKKKFLSLSIISKKINWKNRNKKKERLKWPWPHPLPKKTSRPLSSPCPCYVLCARKSCNHVQISIICLKCEFFLAKNWIVLNRMTKKLSSVLFFIYIHWVSKVLKYPKVFGGFDNIFYVYLMRGVQKYERNWILLMAFWATANSAHLAAYFCPALFCPQKATVKIQFLPYFWNPLIK